MRAGLLNHRVSFYRRNGTAWTNYKTAWALIMPPENERDVRQTSIRAPYLDTVKLRYDSDVRSGQLMVWGSQWFFVEALSEIDTRRAEMLLSCREFLGFAGTYSPVAGGTYPCIAFPVERNEWQGAETTLNQNEYFVDVLIPQLGASFAEHNDQITFAGLDYSVISSTNAGDDNIAIRLLLKPN